MLAIMTTVSPPTPTSDWSGEGMVTQFWPVMSLEDVCGGVCERFSFLKRKLDREEDAPLLLL